MALDRWIAFIILIICLAYGYGAFFAMDGALPPIMKRSPIWPSSFPKVLATGGVLVSLWIIIGFERTAASEKAPEINLERMGEYKFGQAAILLALMVVYAFALRPLGFVAATFLFLFIGSFILGERRFVVMALVAAIAAGVVWYLVDQILGVFLSPLPQFLLGA